jgi:biotin-(acetyl-CoA carboxylase) ligase
MNMVTREQWGGKGQRDNKWVSKDENLIMSANYIETLTRFSEIICAFFNSIVAGTCHKTSNFSGEGTFINGLMIYISMTERQGGILIENVFNGHDWEWAVVGINY